MDRLVRALLADGWFASLQHLPTGWCVLTDAPPWVVARLAVAEQIEVTERLSVGHGAGYTLAATHPTRNASFGRVASS
ncbi:MAG: hypothetical protein R3D51_00515 [Hyphomicrobiaceae bacterium]